MGKGKCRLKRYQRSELQLPVVFIASHSQDRKHEIIDGLLIGTTWPALCQLLYCSMVPSTCATGVSLQLWILCFCYFPKNIKEFFLSSYTFLTVGLKWSFSTLMIPMGFCVWVSMLNAAYFVSSFLSLKKLLLLFPSTFFVFFSKVSWCGWSKCFHAVYT